MSSESRKIFSLSIFSAFALESPFRSAVYSAMLFVAVPIYSDISYVLPSRRRTAPIPDAPGFPLEAPSQYKTPSFIRLFLSNKEFCRTSGTELSQYFSSAQQTSAAVCSYCSPDIFHPLPLPPQAHCILQARTYNYCTHQGQSYRLSLCA